MKEVGVFGNGLFIDIAGFIEANSEARIRIIYISILHMTQSYVCHWLTDLLLAITLAVVNREVLIYVHGVEQWLIVRFTLVTDLVLCNFKLELLVYMNS